MNGTTVTFDAQVILTWVTLVVAVVGAVVAVARWTVKAIRHEVTQATQQIQPDANGGYQPWLGTSRVLLAWIPGSASTAGRSILFRRWLGTVLSATLDAKRADHSRVQLAYPRLGHPEDVPDLGGRHLEVVVEGGDDLFPLGEGR